MTELERGRAIAIGRCTFTPGTFAKRFAGTISIQATGSRTITDAQARRLAIQCWIFRKQIAAMANVTRGKGDAWVSGADLLPDGAPEGYQTPRERERAAIAETERRHRLADNALAEALRGWKQGMTLAMIVVQPGLEHRAKHWLVKNIAPSGLGGTVVVADDKQTEPVLLLWTVDEVGGWVNRDRKRRVGFLRGVDMEGGSLL